ncbi:hypothetical protein Glove_213g88 [Diversispora epigaea]|uniref:BACK domain-containing protein n=1 Tax=Diversispora epigaea TaxID=1348612 RepID=A0A397IS10_9GLOM|nr:hypothetical protein Glove_213g88 [Diversispora epigaea]
MSLNFFDKLSQNLIELLNDGDENCETIFIYDLMLAANEFELEELTNKLEILIETKVRTILENWKNFVMISVKYPNLIFYADDFTSLEEPALVSLLKRNDLQNLGLCHQTTLQQCLPHIRYFHLSVRSILVTELPPRSKESFSAIISEEHATEIST